MKTLLFDAPPDHILVDRGNQIHGGEKFLVDDARAEELLTQPGLHVELISDAGDLASLSRAELNQVAATSSIEAPEKLANKDAVIAAINSPPEADTGEGLPEDDTEPKE